MARGQNLGVLCGFVACVLLAFWFSTVVAMGPVPSTDASGNGASHWLHWPSFRWWDWLNWWGLVLNFVGTLIVGLSIGKPRRGGLIDNSSECGGITYIAAVLYPRAFWFGLGIIAVGFMMQIASPWHSVQGA
jgi:hypothetical protein